ncbi:hypothetical protein [Azospirillum sp. sgz301742]
MLEILALALVLSVFGGVVSHILAQQFGAMGTTAGLSATWTPANRLRRIHVVAEDNVPGPTWASFPRAF